MRFTTVVVFGVAAVSTSASLVVRQLLPICYDTCVEESDSGGCSATDVVCLCKNPNFVSETIACLESTCTGSDLTQALAYGQSVCAAYGVTASGIGLAPSSTSTPSASSTGLGSASMSKSAAAVRGVNAFVNLAAVGLVTLAL